MLCLLITMHFFPFSILRFRTSELLSLVVKGEIGTESQMCGYHLNSASYKNEWITSPASDRLKCLLENPSVAEKRLKHPLLTFLQNYRVRCALQN